jgi:rSAM/selenodomain-associated transferase 1
LVIFTKNPEAGKVKTRLAATIGSDAALSVYKKLIEHTVLITCSLPMDKVVFYSDHVTQEDAWDANHYFKQLQTGKDLGERMNNAFADVFRAGYSKAVLIGTDCPELNDAIILEAFDKLDDVDVVIGPAVDGGYYLIGLKTNCSFLFQNIKWSTRNVLLETINKCKSAELLFILLQSLRDVDEEKDLLSSKLHWL